MLTVSPREGKWGTYVIDLAGKLTIGGGDIALRDAVDKALSNGHGYIVLNLAEVNYMDNAGMGELIACYKRALMRKSKLKCVKPSGMAIDLISLTKLHEFMDFYETEEKAILAF